MNHSGIFIKILICFFVVSGCHSMKCRCIHNSEYKSIYKDDFYIKDINHDSIIIAFGDYFSDTVELCIDGKLFFKKYIETNASIDRSFDLVTIDLSNKPKTNVLFTYQGECLRFELKPGKYRIVEINTPKDLRVMKTKWVLFYEE